MSHRLLVRTLAVAGVAALAACSDSSTGPSTQVSSAQQSADLAVSAGAATTSDLTLMAGDMAQAGTGSGCTWNATAGDWTCARATENGLTVERTITFYSGGATQQNYSATTTDSIHVHAVASGTITRDNGTISLDHTRDVTIKGLAGAETQRTVAGSGTRTESSTFTGDRGTRTYAGTVSNQIQDVVLPVGGGYPLSGSMVHDVTATMTFSGSRTETRQVSRHIVVTFNGTATVPMTVGTASCTLHLDTKTVSCAQ